MAPCIQPSVEVISLKLSHYSHTTYIISCNNLFINKIMTFKIYKHSIVRVIMNKHCVQLKWEIRKEVVFDAEEQKHQKRIDLKSF